MPKKVIIPLTLALTLGGGVANVANAESIATIEIPQEQKLTNHFVFAKEISLVPGKTLDLETLSKAIAYDKNKTGELTIGRIVGLPEGALGENAKGQVTVELKDKSGKATTVTVAYSTKADAGNFAPAIVSGASANPTVTADSGKVLAPVEKEDKQKNDGAPKTEEKTEEAPKTKQTSETKEEKQDPAPTTEKVTQAEEKPVVEEKKEVTADKKVLIEKLDKLIEKGKDNESWKEYFSDIKIVVESDLTEVTKESENVFTVLDENKDKVTIDFSKYESVTDPSKLTREELSKLVQEATTVNGVPQSQVNSETTATVTTEANSQNSPKKDLPTTNTETNTTTGILAVISAALVAVFAYGRKIFTSEK